MKAPFAKLWADRESLREQWRLLALAAASLILAYVFGKVGSEVLEGEMFTVDQTVRTWMQQRRSPVADGFFSIVTHLGAKEVLAPIAALIGWRLFRGTARLTALLAFCGLAAAEFVAILKRSFHVMRPTGGISAGLGFSFPSGHATGSLAVAIVVSWVAFRRRTAAVIVATLSAVLVVLVAFSRLYLDMHWTSDIVGGWAVGAAFGVGCCAVYEWLDRDERGKG